MAVDPGTILSQILGSGGGYVPGVWDVTRRTLSGSNSPLQSIRFGNGGYYPAWMQLPPPVAGTAVNDLAGTAV